MSQGTGGHETFTVPMRFGKGAMEGSRALESYRASDAYGSLRISNIGILTFGTANQNPDNAKSECERSHSSGLLVYLVAKETPHSP